MKDSGSKQPKKIKETEYSKIELEEGIALCYYKVTGELDISIAKTIVKNRVDFFEGVAYPCLFDITSVKHSTKEARDYLANEGNELVVASAIVTDSPMIKMMANFYIKVNKPQSPTRMFTDKASALEWLHQFKSTDS